MYRRGDSKIEEKGEESRTSEEEEEDLSETAEDREASASEEQSAQEGMKAAGYDYDRDKSKRSSIMIK